MQPATSALRSKHQPLLREIGKTGPRLFPLQIYRAPGGLFQAPARLYNRSPQVTTHGEGVMN